jgi:hypothetical protein
VGSSILFGGLSADPDCAYSHVAADVPVSGSDNMLVSDPLFVSLSPPYDYHLSSGSPCRELGNAAGAPTEDFDGDARPVPVGTRPDVGADEIP